MAMRDGTVTAKGARQRRIAKWMRSHGWSHRTPDNGIRRRLWCLANDRHRWWDWGHRLMVLTGTEHGGSWDAPSPPTWWYRAGAPKRMARTGYPTHPLRTFHVVKDYDEFRSLTEGLNEDGMYEWQAMCVDSDGDMQLGHRYWGGSFYGMRKAETALLRKYLRMWRRLDWYGLRSWLYSQGLHAAVHRSKPFACREVPPKGSGGYSHWHCELRRRHAGAHRFNSYTWTTPNRVVFDGDASRNN